MFVVADTNFYMQHDILFDKVDFRALLSGTEEYAAGGRSIHSGRNIHLLVPMVVVDELDGQKRRDETDKRRRARQVLAVLDRLFKDPDQQVVVRDQCLAWWDWWLHGSESAAMWTASGLWEHNGAPFQEYFCNGVRV